MRRRPQPSRRRGILRALAAAVLLIILLLVAVLVASSLTAPSVHAPAPTAPSTPGLAHTPTRTPTRIKPPTATPAPIPTATKKRGALGVSPGRHQLQDQVNRQLVDRAVSGLGRTTSARPTDFTGPAAYFRQTGDAYSPNPLYVASGTPRHAMLVGYGDALVRPVLSSDGRFVAFVRVAQSSTFPGASWSLMVIDTRSRQVHQVVRHAALSLTPLGWSSGRLFYLVATSTETSIYSYVHGAASFVGIMIPQPLSSARLSPGGRYIAFATPVNCSDCTLNIYDLDAHALWIGPTGLPNETALTWATEGDNVVALIGNRLHVVSAGGHTSQQFSLPAGLPSVWNHPMTAVVSDGLLRLSDAITGRTFHLTQG